MAGRAMGGPSKKKAISTKEEAIEVYENCSEEFAYETICRYRYPDKYPFQRSTEYEDY